MRRTDAEAPILWPPDMKSSLSGKDLDAGKGFPCGSAAKESAHNVGDQGSIPGLGRHPEEGKGYPLQYSGLENSMDCIVHGVAESDTTEPLSLTDARKDCVGKEGVAEDEMAEWHH